MPRRLAVLLTPPHSIPNSSLFCTFCALLQKSGAHPLTFQLLPRSLQKPQVSPKAFLQLPDFSQPSNLRTFKRAISFRTNTYSRSPRFAVFWPKLSARNSFRCNTYRLSACNSFIRNTYKKGGGGGYAN